LNEKSLKAKNIPFKEVHVYSSSHAKYYPGSTRSGLKILFNPIDGTLLGGQVVGNIY
jgi:hypothetical protein